jgi:hypothetical protein
MSRRNVTAAMVLLFLISATTGFAAERYQWYPFGSDEECQIYVSPIIKRKYIAAQTSCVIPARMEVINMILRDIANYPEWMEDCKATKILKVVDEEKDVFIVWYHQHIPVYPDRDMIFKSKILMDLKNGRNIVYAGSTDEIHYDTGKGYVRMPSFYSIFTMEWIDREHTRVTFMIDPDLGEGLPMSESNVVIKDITYKSLKKMMKMAKKSKYIETAKKSKYKKYIEDGIKKGYLK